MIVTKYLSAFATGIALAVVGVATAKNPAAPATETAAATAAPQPAAGDSEALSTLSAVNKHEIAAAELAESKKMDTAAMDYAKMLLTDHTANLKKVEEISQLTKTPIAETPAVKELKAKTSAERDALAKLDGAAFQTAYLDAMIKGHANVQSLIDTKLLPGATDVAVQQHLRNTRESVAKHHDHAKELRGQAK
jgi:putative membrane protein